MTSSTDIPTLLRFLTRSCSIPLAKALGAVPKLQASNLASTSALASTNVAIISSIFDSDAKLCKKIIAAAKKEEAGQGGSKADTARKKRKREDDHTFEEVERRNEIDEEDLALPDPLRDVSAIEKKILIANRAPFLLALTERLLKHTMPSQPQSSRLSLAQALVSANAKSKATSIGLRTEEEQRRAAEGEIGRRKLKIMGREVAVMRRDADDAKVEAFWGLDVDANTALISSTLPIHTPQAARAYMLKSFASEKGVEEKLKSSDQTADNQHNTAEMQNTKPKKKIRSQLNKEDDDEKTHNLALLLGSLDLLFESWKHLSREELDRRAWQWYVLLRPDVENGPKGWGGKGQICLSKILELRK